MVPLLVHGTQMPEAHELPESIRDLAFRNGIPVRADPDFHNDMERLKSGLTTHLVEPARPGSGDGARTSAEEPVTGALGLPDRGGADDESGGKPSGDSRWRVPLALTCVVLLLGTVVWFAADRLGPGIPGTEVDRSAVGETATAASTQALDERPEGGKARSDEETQAALALRREREAQARAEEEALRAAEERSREEAEAKVRREEEARAEAEAQARREAEAQARREADEQARAEAQARREAEERGVPRRRRRRGRGAKHRPVARPRLVASAGRPATPRAPGDGGRGPTTGRGARETAGRRKAPRGGACPRRRGATARGTEEQEHPPGSVSQRVQQGVLPLRAQPGGGRRADARSGVRARASGVSPITTQARHRPASATAPTYGPATPFASIPIWPGYRQCRAVWARTRC